MANGVRADVFVPGGRRAVRPGIIGGSADASSIDARGVRDGGRPRLGGPRTGAGQRGYRYPSREPAPARRGAGEPGHVRALRKRQLLLLPGRVLRIQTGRVVHGAEARWPVGGGRARVCPPAAPVRTHAVLPGTAVRVEGLARGGGTPLAAGVWSAVGGAPRAGPGGASSGASRAASRGGPAVSASRVS